MNILKAVNLRKIYGQGETEVRALDGINLEVEKGEFVAIVGTSGSGKSTLLHIIGGLDNPTSGQVIVDGQNLSHMPDEELTIFRRRNIGFVFQQYNLVPMLNVWENIVLPVKLDGKKIEKKKMSREVSLYEPIGTDKEGNEIHLFDVIESGECDASEHYCKKEDICRLHRGIQTVLLPKEKRVVVLRYGLFGHLVHTQKEVGSVLGISRSYVSRIEKSALEKLRSFLMM